MYPQKIMPKIGERAYKKVVRVHFPTTGEERMVEVTAETKDELNLKVAVVKARLIEERDRLKQERDKKLLFDSIPCKHFSLELQDNGGISVGLLGASRSGKTSALKYIYKTYFNKCLSVMTTLSAQNEIYRDMSKRLIVDNEFHPELLREMYLINHGTSNKYDFCYILDDYNGGNSKTSTETTRLLTIYRNSYINAILCNQDPTLISSVGRGNLNYVCLFHFNTPQVTEKVIKMFLTGYFPTELKMSEKIKMYDTLTLDHHFFLLDNLKGTIHLCKLTEDQLGIQHSSSSEED
jgi:hypothetical protein